MEHNHVVSTNPKSIGILQVHRLSTGPPDLGCYSIVSKLRYTITCSVMGMGLGYGVAM